MKLSNTQHNQVVLYDTTLRDGAQRKGISFSLEDKLKITKLLDDFGVSYIEGGWPGSNPKDFEYFQRVKSMRLKHARVVAFGSTRKAGVTAAEDQNTARLLEAGTDCVALVGKSSSKHVLKVLRTTLEENLEMIKDSISYLKSHGKEVIFDAEHYFDGFEEDQEYSLKALLAAQEAGADWLVLCDTNGRHIPSRIREIVAQTNAVVSVPLGIHAHNDGELAVANSIAAVEAGAKQIQGTINGYGERCGNANLISLAPTLQLKMGYQCVPQKSLVRLTELSRTVSEIANLSPDPYAPYVGSAAFAHKAGLHAAAVEKFAASYEHMQPELVGNTREILISELSGRGNVRLLASQISGKMPFAEQEVLDRIKELEQKGYKFEDAQGSVELMIRRDDPQYVTPFELIEIMVVVNDRIGQGSSAEAVVKVKVGDTVHHTVSVGRGPVHALDNAFRKALAPVYPQIENVRLVDYKVRILDPDQATEATTRVVIEAANDEERWSTVGVSDNIIEASCQALVDSLELYLARCSSSVQVQETQEVVA
ncbi:citramalate synthase [Candidatus Obscuribacterales bacterium]|nr:citramalate synthase [Candidatus Obscuribacterales bacterium]MBX3151147.1 citramalate synthase [Candidatus Obscuribacterales bacterium]